MLNELHARAVEADERFQTALVARYGARAGDMRYRTNQLPVDIKTLALEYQAASKAWISRVCGPVENKVQNSQ